MTKPQLVFVKWEDAAGLDSSTWATETKHEYKPQIMHTVGYLLADVEEGIIITSTWSENGILAPRDQIPRGMIIDMKVLKEPKCK